MSNLERFQKLIEENVTLEVLSKLSTKHLLRDSLAFWEGRFEFSNDLLQSWSSRLSQESKKKLLAGAFQRAYRSVTRAWLL